MSFIPLSCRRNKLVNIGVKSPTLEYGFYFLKIIVEEGKSYTTTTENETYVRNIIENNYIKDTYFRFKQKF